MLPPLSVATESTERLGVEMLRLDAGPAVTAPVTKSELNPDGDESASDEGPRAAWLTSFTVHEEKGPLALNAIAPPVDEVWLAEKELTVFAPCRSMDWPAVTLRLLALMLVDAPG